MCSVKNDILEKLTEEEQHAVYKLVRDKYDFLDVEFEINRLGLSGKVDDDTICSIITEYQKTRNEKWLNTVRYIIRKHVVCGETS